MSLSFALDVVEVSHCQEKQDPRKCQVLALGPFQCVAADWDHLATATAGALARSSASVAYSLIVRDDWRMVEAHLEGSFAGHRS